MVKQIHVFFLLFTASILIGCAAPGQRPVSEDSTVAALQDDTFYQQIEQITRQIETGDTENTPLQLAELENIATSDNHHSLLAYAYARLFIAENNYLAAAGILNSTSTRQHLQQSDDTVVLLISLLNAEILEAQQQALAAARLRVYLAPIINDETQYQQNHQAIWRLLAQADIDENTLQRFSQEQDLLHWLQLSRIVQHSTLSLDQQLRAIDQWLADNSLHPAAKWPPQDIDMIRHYSEQRPQKIAVILPLEGKYRALGTAIRDGLMRAWFESGHQPLLVFYNFDELPGFLDVYHEAIFDGADMVIGPLFKEQLQELLQYQDILPVPTIALNRLDDSTLARPQNLFEYSLSSDDEIRSLITLAQRQQHHNAIVIHQPDSWAQRAADTFISEWQQQQGKILASASFDNTREQSALVQNVLNLDKSRQRSRELQWLTGLTLENEPRRRQDIDLILLITRPEAAASIRPLLSFHYASNIPVYANSSVYRGYPNPSFDNDLNGIYFTDAPLVINSQSLGDSSYRQSPFIRMHAMGMDAFRLSERIQLLAQLPLLTLPGASGQLSVENGIVQRQTAYARFVRGRVQSISLPDETGVQDQHAETDNTADR